jgi:hypothetical protein
MKIIMAIFIGLIITSCSHYRPVVDLQGEDRELYEWNLKDCQRYAKEISPGNTTVAGAGIGAGIGAVAGLIIGTTLGVDAGKLAGFGAAIGGMHGALSGGGAAAQSQMEIIKNCLKGRGYNVLN